MAESLLPEVIPGMVAVEYVGKSNDDTGERKGMTKNVFPIDAKELVATGNYKMVENGAVEAARLNANPLRSAQAAGASLVAAEVTGIGGQVHVASSEEGVKQAVKAADHGGEDVPARQSPPATAPAKAPAEKK